ncbi:hypothetical protein JCM11251_000824 [Rhodosporidiobolus azoricus]
MSTAHAYTLLSALVPREVLPVRAILLILSSFGEISHSRPLHAGKVDYKLQRRALEQLAVLHELGAVEKEGREVLDRLYGVVERGLDYRTLREPTAAILCQIIRRHHVLPHRINALQTRIRTLDSPSASLFRLANLYRSFQPEQVYEHRGREKKERGLLLEEWKSTAQNVLEVAGGVVNERESKRLKLSSNAYIPLPATYSTDLAAPSALPLSDVTTISSFAANVDILALPSQAASVLSAVAGSPGPSGTMGEEERSRAWALLLRCGYDGNSDHIHRLSVWLISQLQHQIYDRGPSADQEARVGDLFCRLRELSEMGGELPEELEPFLAEYLLQWDGLSHRKVVFELVSLLKPLGWQELQGHFLSPIERLTRQATDEWTADLIDCLTSFVVNLAGRDDWEDGVSRTTVFGRLDESDSYLDCLQHLLTYSDGVIASATLRFPSSLAIRSSALALYEMAYSLPLKHGLAVTILPSTVFTYTCLLSNEIMSLSRMCGLIVKLRQVLTGPESVIHKDDIQNADLVATLNARLVDFVNALWQKKFLVTAADGKTLGLEGHEVDLLRSTVDERGQAANSSQGLTIHAALAVLAKECFTALSERQGSSATAATLLGPVSAGSLKQLGKQQDPTAPPLPSFNEFRPAFLEHLKQQGADGLHDFLFSSLQSLINRTVLLTMDEGGKGEL